MTIPPRVAGLLLVLLAAAGAVLFAVLRGPPREAARPSAPPAAPAVSGAGPGLPPASTVPASPERPSAEARRLRAVEQGLGWLRRAQEPDGSWDLVRWNPWHGRPGLSGFSEEDHWFAPAATGLALLALLEAAPPGAALEPALERGLERLLAWQGPDGRVGVDEELADAWFRDKLGAPGLASPQGPGYKALTLHTFNHAVPAAAFAVAAARTKLPRWIEAAKKALAHFAADEHPEYRWTAYLDPESDIGSAAYVVLAARAGADAGLAEQAQAILRAAPDYLERVTDSATGRTRMLSDVPACFDGDDSTAINAYARRLLGQAPDAAPLRLALASLCREAPRWAAAALPAATGTAMFHEHLGAVVNHDAWTYAVRALKDVPGARAQAQREAIRALLIDNQATAGEHAGSWEPIGVWDRVGGRLYATAMGVRALIDP